MIFNYIFENRIQLLVLFDAAWTADRTGTKDKYLALFNKSDSAEMIKINLKDISFSSGTGIKDLSADKLLGRFSSRFFY